MLSFDCHGRRQSQCLVIRPRDNVQVLPCKLCANLQAESAGRRFSESLLKVVDDADVESVAAGGQVEDAISAFVQKMCCESLHCHQESAQSDARV